MVSYRGAREDHILAQESIRPTIVALDQAFNTSGFFVAIRLLAPPKRQLLHQIRALLEDAFEFITR